MSNLILSLNESSLTKDNNVLTPPGINEPVFINETGRTGIADKKAALALDAELDGEGNFILGYN
ncbi:hypothetical protein SG34_009325 [Thalassomonas viridans]|uniref:Uncharacterized protein n=1 Tax=Thalassomonas viridans TaxID=137584 RepID=A0AAF0CB00_9GAMM|nr:hypothetical protein [Thalassomonas viridans]WDE07066.1 hypothetical protein SG34_009325 [Thalassomonas viridans]